MDNNKQAPTYSEYQNLTFHPYNVMLFLLLAAVTALFLATAVAYVYTRVEKGAPPLHIPWLFGVNTLLLLASSFTMVRAHRAYLRDDTTDYQRSLIVTIVLTLLFLGMQVMAWQQLFSQNVFLGSDNSASYLYILSGLHFAHVIAGLPFLWMFVRSAKAKMKEPVTVLVYFSDPDKRLKLRLLSIYWHFLDGLWVFLVLFFLVNALVS